MSRPGFPGVLNEKGQSGLMSATGQAQSPPVGTVTGHAPALPAGLLRGCECPRVIRMPAEWWESPAAAGCALTGAPESAGAARRFTRATLGEWGLTALATDAEMIVGELVANAVTHAAVPERGGRRADDAVFGLRLLRRSGAVVCAVLDSSSALPVLRPAGAMEESGRGLRMVDALSDVWGWSPVAGRGKSVWAILFCPEREPACLPGPDAAQDTMNGQVGHKPGTRDE